jgi:hypothetical protein
MTIGRRFSPRRRGDTKFPRPARGHGYGFVQTYFLMLLADAWLRLGRPDEAAGAIKEGLARAEATCERFSTAELYRLRARLPGSRRP